MKKSQFLEMEKIAENCKISQKFWVLRQILDKMDVQLCENLQSERYFNTNKLSYIFYLN